MSDLKDDIHTIMNMALKLAKYNSPDLEQAKANVEKRRKEKMLTREREEFNLTDKGLDGSIFDDLIEEDGWKTVEESESQYKHDIVMVDCVSKRLSDGKFFGWGYMRSYNNGIMREYLESAREVFPRQQTVTVYE